MPEDLIVLGLTRTTTFYHTYRRRFERLREESEERGTGLWSACPGAARYRTPGQEAESEVGARTASETTPHAV